MSKVLTEVRDSVGVITLNDPDKRNAIDGEMVDGIIAACEQLEGDESIGAIVVTGAPPAFCAGANLGNLAKADRDVMLSVYEGFLRVGRSPLPTVAAVNGAAVGAGMNLALCCDVRIAGRSARFETRFLDLGLHPGGGHTWMLRDAVGVHHAKAMVLFGQAADGAEAERIGLAWRCVDDDALLEEAVAVAARAASGPRQLVLEMKRTFDGVGALTDIDRAVDRELHPQLWSISNDWFSERIAALRKRISGSD